MMMDAFHLNLWAVLVAGIINMVVGSVWYMPAVFGTIWMREIGMKPGAPMGDGMAKSYGITFIGALVMGYVTSLIIHYAGATTVAEGLKVGLWLWLGFAVTIPLNDVVFGKKTVTLYSLNAAYYLVVILLTSMMLAVWR